MHQYKISLDNSSKKFPCPGCRKKRLVKYRDNEKGKYIADHVGRCDRESSCGYHYTPKEYFAKNPSKEHKADWRQTTKLIHSNPAKPIDILPESIYQASMKAYQSNFFTQYLVRIFGHNKAAQLIRLFNIGTSKQWKGGTIFWQMDINGRLRQAKVMLYDPSTGKRRKDGNFVLFLGKKILGKQANFAQCFFGENQLNTASKSKPIALVESEKTAILMAAVYPKYSWLATGGSNGAKWDSWNVAKVLEDRNVVLFPDLNCWEAWKEKAKKLRPICKSVIVSRLIQDIATREEIDEGLDIADFFDFESVPNWHTESLPRLDGILVTNLINEHGYPASWDEIDLEAS